jgi:uncharacterized membrane protein YfcA
VRNSPRSIPSEEKPRESAALAALTGAPVGMLGGSHAGPARPPSSASSSSCSSLVAPMGLGSVAGALGGGLLVPFVPRPALKLVLGAILIVSAIRIFHHART